MATTYDRVLNILALFGSDRPLWTIEDAANALNLPTSTAYRYFKSLVKSELITPHWAGGYGLGPAICELDRSMRRHDPFIQASRTVMRELVEAFGETIILLARLYKGKVMCVHREGHSLAIQGYERGRPMPLERGAASKVILAHLTPRQLKGTFSFDGNDELATTALRAELRDIRAQGFAVTRGEIDPGRMGVSVPVFRSNNVLEGSLSFVIQDSRMTEQDELVQALIRSRKTIEANLLLAEFQSGVSDPANLSV